jgi:hypothetical protein
MDGRLKKLILWKVRAKDLRKERVAELIVDFARKGRR